MKKNIKRKERKKKVETGAMEVAANGEDGETEDGEKLVFFFSSFLLLFFITF